MQKKPNKVIDFIKKNKTLLLLGAISLVIFHQYLAMIILSIIFVVLGINSLQISRVVPHISVETVTASSILMGYLWGWKVGLIFGIAVGMIGYIKISLIKLTTIVNALFMGFCGVLAALFASMGYTFVIAYLLTFLIRANLGFLVFRQLNPDLVENIMHSYGDAIFNSLITIHFMQIIYNIVVNFV